jgi:hypothetical protein
MRQMRLSTLLVILGTFGMLSGCGGPEPGATGLGNAEPAAPADGELLLASAPSGWTETATMATPALRMAEYGPADEDDGQIERVTFESQSASPLPDPL